MSKHERNKTSIGGEWMNIELMKTIILNLSEWMNTPNDELEDMMGISWSQFWDLIQEIREQ